MHSRVRSCWAIYAVAFLIHCRSSDVQSGSKYQKVATDTKDSDGSSAAKENRRLCIDISGTNVCKLEQILFPDKDYDGAGECLISADINVINCWRYLAYRRTVKGDKDGGDSVPQDLDRCDTNCQYAKNLFIVLITVAVLLAVILIVAIVLCAIKLCK
ncbi:MAG: hypothetical protein MHMPM18_001776 [Marteilia pararefringens]